MNIKYFLLTAGASLALGVCVFAQNHSFTVRADSPGADIQPTMYGIFFEDINFAADGGLYAEMVENRSFEYPQPFQGWDAMGKVELGDSSPAFERNPKYASLLYTGHREKHTALVNRGYFGMGLKEGMGYDFCVYARKHDASSQAPAVFKAELLDRYGNVQSEATFTVASAGWTRQTATLQARKTTGDGRLRLQLVGEQGVDVDHVSLFPQDSWNGLRADLVQDLADLHPGVLRFPGGCIVEGADLETRYQWKNTVGPAENRPLNENRWNNTYSAKYAPGYFQSLGLGFYEFFLLAEEIGASPLPIVSVGLACQFQNSTMDAHVPVDELGPYVQDALDLIEFANGPVSSTWGAQRAAMGHPAPFGLKYLGVGNEQWGTIYPERLEVFVKAIRAQYPEIEIVGSAGPSAYGGDFDYLWNEMNRLGVDLVDEHYYMSPTWFLSNAKRYDDYDRSWPKVFAGEYAAHIVGRGSVWDPVEILSTPRPGLGSPSGSNGLRYLAPEDPRPSASRPSRPEPPAPDQAPFFKNNFRAALCEAAFMTGLERNADVVYMSAYAPLFAHAEGWQWDPDLIWFDNLSSVRTPSYYVQQMYAWNAGTRVLPLLEDGAPVVGADGLYATACFDAPTGDYIVKIINAGDSDKHVSVTFRGVSSLGNGTLTSLHAADDAFNSLEDKEAVVPVITTVRAASNVLDVTVPASTFQLYRF